MNKTSIVTTEYSVQPQPFYIDSLENEKCFNASVYPKNENYSPRQ